MVPPIIFRYHMPQPLHLVCIVHTYVATFYMFRESATCHCATRLSATCYTSQSFSPESAASIPSHAFQCPQIQHHHRRLQRHADVDAIAPFGNNGTPDDPLPARHVANGSKKNCCAVGQSAIAERAAAPADRLRRPMAGGRRWMSFVLVTRYNGPENGQEHY